MSRTKHPRGRGRHRGCRGGRGCTKCDWWPERLQTPGRRLAKVEARENEDAADLGLIRYDHCAACQNWSPDEPDALVIVMGAT